MIGSPRYQLTLLQETAPAVNEYEKLLSPPRSVMDVAYWLNVESVAATSNSSSATSNSSSATSNSSSATSNPSSSTWFCLNCAVEESALVDRARGMLLPQDEFLRDSIQESDTLIVSIGGNDIALKPSLMTIICMFVLCWLIPTSWIEKAGEQIPHGHRGYCYINPPGLGHFITMFKTKVEGYVARLCATCKPRKVVVCIIYYPNESCAVPSWADPALRLLKYNTDPNKLQLIIKTMFTLATQNVQVPGTTVVPFPLFRVLDGKTESDYVARVEPSASGGRKIAKELAKLL